MDDSTKNALDSVEEQIRILSARVRTLEKQIDTLGSAWYKRLWWRLDGFPPWWVINPNRKRRFWH